MRDLEETLRDAVQDLADDAPHAYDLAGAARVQGRRIRRRRHAAAALAVLAVVTVPFVWLRPEPRIPVVHPAPTPSVTVQASVRPLPDFMIKTPYRLPGDAVVTMVTIPTRVDDGVDENTHVSLDRDAGRYRQLPFDYGRPAMAPDGKRFAAKISRYRTDVVNTAGGVVDTLNVDTDLRVGADPVWSPDGSRLLVPVKGGFAVYETGTGNLREFDNADVDSLCSDFCSFSWLPNGREFAVPRLDVSVPRSEAHPDRLEGVVVYSTDTGERVRSIPMVGVPVGNGAWSPDGRTVLVHEKTETTDGIRVVDAVNGAPRSGLFAGPDAIYLADGRILAFGNRYAQIHAADGTLLEEYRMPRQFTDGVTLTVARS
ncbi:hypothetical protein Q0Z83_088410 [Actinoplanes sichuanensis]|uniref:WD40-like Beta Propeller Repeat n=1 Tax=Actinoplanes sichuanensis TaxID=512349 RepID=A0ABW4A386_9ACTN|nr:hypothetical protein [Actinoplanes sichuanensis]BEL10650.1 hypothetical protein Q0Z83_088410 [Actinoplanes sichuanensis]